MASNKVGNAQRDDHTAESLKGKERTAFQERLLSSLSLSGFENIGPTKFAKEFNRRYSGDPISIHGARKWLLGESIPNQEKMKTLAIWFGVSINWLRYGEDAPKEKTETQEPPNETLEDIRRLSPESKLLVRDFIQLLLRHERGLKK